MRGITRMYILSVYFSFILVGVSVPLTLLGLLEREPSHGYDLKRDYDTFFGRGKPLPFGQVYATLGRLARDGKVTGGQAEPGDGPDRKRYAITELGASEFDDWLEAGLQLIVIECSTHGRQVYWHARDSMTISRECLYHLLLPGK